MVTAAWPHDLARQREHVSPDGQYRAFVANDGGGTPQIFVYSAGADASWLLTFMTGMAYNPVWSPRGDLIAFLRIADGHQDGESGIFSIGPDGTDEEPVWP